MKISGARINEASSVNISAVRNYRRRNAYNLAPNARSNADYEQCRE